MEGLPKIKQENIIEKPKIKEGVDFVFEQNPEFSQIGTEEQYSEYLDTIFPESKVRDIVYHGSKEKINKFYEPTSELSLGKPAIYFRKKIEKHAKDKLISHQVIINSEFPLIVNDFNEYSEIKNRRFHDSVYIKDEDEFAVFTAEKVYILGVNQDLENFKKFVENNKNTQG